MLTQQLGDTPLRVTRIGLGMAAIGRPGYINLGHEDDLQDRTDKEDLERHSHAVLSAAHAAGIRHFDTARSYGFGEAFLGRWLAANRIADSTVSSKWGYRYVADWTISAEVHEIKEHSLPALERQYLQSLANLGDYLDIYQIHSATVESGVLDNSRVIDRLAELRDSGTIVGLTTSGPRQAEVIRRAIAIERGGDRVFGTVQSTWNLLEQSAGPALAKAHDSGMGVLIKESMANGRLTARDPVTTAPLVLTYPGETPDAIAIAAVLNQPWVDVVISGAATIAQLKSNLRALDLNGDKIAGLPSIVEEPGAYWATRSSLAWT